MRFLLDLVSCCGCYELREKSISENPYRPRPAEDETRSLVVPNVGRNNRRKKRAKSNVGRRSSGEASEWKPSLRAISEDTIAMEKEKKIESERERSAVAKRKTGGGGGSHQRATRVRSRSYNSYDYGRNSMTNTIPAFSPTPFMF